MIFPALPRRAFACAASLCLIASAAAAQEQQLSTITITGARFTSDPSLMPIGATVITADAIRLAGASDVNQAIRKVGGVYGRQSVDGSQDFSLDLRGFGSNSSQNMVVVVDGVRMSENELASAVLSSIPIETVERIEIIRGGASVLFGEGATGGVIQVVTKRPAKNSTRGVLRAEAGQFGYRDLRASVAHARGALALDAALGKQRNDNYRDHNAYDQSTFSGGAQWQTGAGRIGLRAEVARQDAELAGSLSLAQFNSDPRTSTTQQDLGTTDSDRVTAFAEHRVGSLDLAADLSKRTKESTARYVYGAAVYNYLYDSEQTQFSPRLRHLARMDGMLNEFVAGVDLMRWKRHAVNDFSTSDASQKSRALYLRNELKWNAAHDGRLAFGARRESFDKENVAPGAFVPYESLKQSHTAWEVQGSGNVMAGLNLYAKAGSSFRVPNVDENGYREAAMLKVQTSRDLELGLTAGDSAIGGTVRVFRHALRDEIFYDPTRNFGYGANTNLDPTERKGVELDAHLRLARVWRISAHLQHVNARFTAGVNDGREMVLVPKNVASARLSWLPGNGHSADIGAQWVDRQRNGGDFANTCATPIPSYATVDARYARQAGPWEFAVSGLNLGDRDYYSNAFGCRSGIYPSDGRQLKVSVRYDF